MASDWVAIAPTPIRAAGTALAGPEQLFPRNGEQKLEQVTVKIRIALLMSRLAGEYVRSELPAQRAESCQVFLKRRKVAEPMQPALISREGCSVPFDKAGSKPGSRAQVFGSASERNRRAVGYIEWHLVGDDIERVGLLRACRAT